jgi:hypothetical protein
MRDLIAPFTFRKSFCPYLRVLNDMINGVQDRLIIGHDKAPSDYVS